MRQKNHKMMVVALLVAAIFLAPLSAVNNETTNGAMPRDAVATACTGQPAIEWEKTFGGDEYDYFRGIQQTSDGGYIAFGETEQDDMNYAWLLKLDADGNEEWSTVNQELNGSVYDRGDLANVVIETNDGSFIACGYSTAYYNEYGMWSGTGYLWKVDESGQTDWLKRYQGISEPEGILSIFPFNILEADDGYVMGGLSVVITDPDTGAYTLNGALMKTDGNGNLEWYQTYDGGNDYEALNGLCATDDGGYFLSGLSTTFTMSAGACWVLKTDSEGNKQWEKKFDGPALDYSATRGCGQCEDGGYIIGATTGSYGAGNWDVWVIKTDATGNTEWDKTFGGSGYEQCWGMQILPDGGYVFGAVYDVAGYTGSQADTWIIKTDADGNAEWKYQIEESGVQLPAIITQTADNGYIAAGRTGNADSKSTDAFIVKVGAFENQRPDKPATPSGPARGKTGTEQTYTCSGTDPDGDQLYFRWNWGDGNHSEWLGPYTSGDTCEATYTWTVDGSYTITVTTMDEHDGDSDTSDPLPVSMPASSRPFWTTLLGRLWTLLQQFLAT